MQTQSDGVESWKTVPMYVLFVHFAPQVLLHCLLELIAPSGQADVRIREAPYCSSSLQQI